MCTDARREKDRERGKERERERAGLPLPWIPAPPPVNSRPSPSSEFFRKHFVQAFSLSCSTMSLFNKYSCEQWEEWLQRLPPEGSNGYSKEAWMSWHRAMTEAAGVVSGLVNKKPRARSPSSSRSRSSSASRGSWHSVSRPPPRGPASSKDEPPAQGLPAQGRELIQLQGKNAKERKKFRSSIRAECGQKGVVSAVN